LRSRRGIVTPGLTRRAVADIGWPLRIVGLRRTVGVGGYRAGDDAAAAMAPANSKVLRLVLNIALPLRPVGLPFAMLLR